MMKKDYILSLPLLVLLSLAPSIGTGQEAEIKKIREQYNLIEGYKTTSSTTIFEAQEDPTSGQMTRHYHKGKLVKIDIAWGAEHGGSEESFYYRDGSLVFVFKTDSLWRFTGNLKSDGESETIDTIKEYRFYFNEGKCMRSLFKEAKNTNPDLLNKQIAGIENQTLNDPKLTAAVEKRGRAWYNLFAETTIREVFGD